MTTTDTPPPDAQPGRVRVWFEAAIRDETRLPEAISRPATYGEIWDHARRGHWTTRDEDSAARIPATIWAVGTMAVAGVGGLVKWVVAPSGSPLKAIRNPRTPDQVWVQVRGGAWGTSVNPARRWAANAWAVVATGVAVAVDVATWTAQRFTRLVTATTFTVLIGTALAQVPVIGWLVPDLINVTSW